MVERSLCMREVGGSIPSASKPHFCLTRIFFSDFPLFCCRRERVYTQISYEARLRWLLTKSSFLCVSSSHACHLAQLPSNRPSTPGVD